MFMGSLRSSPDGSRAGDDDEEDDEEALMLGELGGGVHGVCRTSLSTFFSSLPAFPDERSLDGESCDSSGAERAEETAASRLARRGVRRILPLSEGGALRPLSPLPCLKQTRHCYPVCLQGEQIILAVCAPQCRTDMSDTSKLQKNQKWCAMAFLFKRELGF